MKRRRPEDWRPRDAVVVPIVVFGLIVTGVLARFNLMPRRPPPPPPNGGAP